MTAADFITALYQLCFQREPDAPGFEHWLTLLTQTGDHAMILQQFLESEEYQRKQPALREQVKQAVAKIHHSLRIVDIGAQSLGPGTHAYSPLLGHCPIEIIGFDPLPESLQIRQETESIPATVTLLPYALGDGNTHTLHVYSFAPATSLFPANPELRSRLRFIDSHLVHKKQVATHRLDDVLPSGPVDFLKLDIQGAELMVLQNAPRTLSQTAVVHCEVEFSPIYEGQPLFADVDTYLRPLGFDLIDLLPGGYYSYLTSSSAHSPDRLLWADAVYFRQSANSETKHVQALIAAAVYKKGTLAQHLLEQCDAQDKTKDTAPECDKECDTVFDNRCL